MREHLERAGLPLAGARDHLEQFWLAHDERGLIGTAGLERYGDAALLRSVATLERVRGTGLGSALVTHILETAQVEGVRDVVLLTETAHAYFPRFGFQPIAQADVPKAVHASVEFRGACPDSATAMHLHLQD